MSNNNVCVVEMCYFYPDVILLYLSLKDTTSERICLVVSNKEFLPGVLFQEIC